MWRTVAIFVASAMLFLGRSFGEQPVPDDSTNSEPISKTASYEPYCGLYSLHMAMTYLGVDVPFASLLKPENISKREGSTLEDLMRIATEHGLNATPLGGLNCSSLHVAKSPLVLHVKAEKGSNLYRHWLLFMGVDEGKAKIYDGYLEKKMDFAELASRWDGIALQVSNQKISIWPMRFAAYIDVLFYLGLGAIVFLGTRRLYEKLPTRFLGTSFWRSVLSQVALLFVVAIAIGVCYSICSTPGYLRNGILVHTIKDLHWADFLPSLGAEDVKRIANNNSHFFVDARLPQQFRNGHIDGALNIPPSSTPDEIRVLMSGIPKDRPIVVYCELEGCSYSTAIARRLDEVGYEKLSLFPGGWSEWKSHQSLNASR